MIRKHLFWLAVISVLIGFKLLDSSHIERPRAFIKHLFFIENQGQWAGPHLFKANLGPATLFAEKHGLTYLLLDASDMPTHGRDRDKNNDNQDETHLVDCHAYHVSFVGANEHVEVSGRDIKDTYHNYFIGNDSTRWRGHIPLYHGLYYHDLYDGIDLEFYQNNTDFKYDFIIHAGADADAIKLNYEGHEGLKLIKGSLQIKTSIDHIIEAEPYAYQLIADKKIEIPCKYVLQGDELSFRFPDGYNQDYDLVIDPILVFSTYTGSTSDNWGMSSTFDLAGNAYGGGINFDPGFPVTLGAFQINFAGIRDLAIGKFSEDGTQLLYGTYIGGNDSESPQSMIVNSRDELIIIGSTESFDFPTQNAYDNQLNDGVNLFNSDLFVTVMSADGASLVSSTYLGGTASDGLINSFRLAPNYEDERRCEVNLDKDDNIYVALSTESNDFPITAGCLQENAGGGLDAAVVKMNDDASQLVWSTYFGGSGDESATAIRIDDNYDVYVGGSTGSSDLTMPNTGYQSTFSGDVDGYVIKLNNAGDQLVGGTYLGTPERDYCFLIDFDENGDLYALGLNEEKTYPSTGTIFNQPEGINFIQKLSSDLSTGILSAKFGPWDGFGDSFAATAFLVDECNRIYVSGWGSVREYTLTQDALYSVPDPTDTDFYLVVFEPDFTDIEYATFIGQNNHFDHVDGGTSRFDNRGFIYQSACASCGNTSDFPTTPDAYSTTNNASNCNNAVFKLDFQLNEIVTTAAISAIDTGCNPVQVIFNNETTGPVDNFLWYFGDGDSSTVENPSHGYFNGQYTVTLITSSDISCVDPDTTTIELDITAPVLSNYQEIIKCPSDTQFLMGSSPFTIVSTTWQENFDQLSFPAVESGLYIGKSIQDNNCEYIDSILIINLPSPSNTTNIGLCPLDTIQINSPLTDIGSTYVWNTGDTTAAIDINREGIYVVRSRGNDCVQVDSFIVTDAPYSATYSTSIEKCENEVAVLEITEKNNVDFVQWNTGETSTSISPQAGGLYIATTYFVDRCAVIDSFFVTSNIFVEPTLDSISTCEGNLEELSSRDTSAVASYLWSTGDDSQSINVLESGRYSVTTSKPLTCDQVNTFDVIVLPRITEDDFYFPNAFSPNDDGINDIFRPFFGPDIIVLDYDLQVFDRWGNQVFNSDSVDIGWNGIIKRKDQETGVYVYQCRIQAVSCQGENADLQFHGDISIIK